MSRAQWNRSISASVSHVHTTSETKSLLQQSFGTFVLSFNKALVTPVVKLIAVKHTHMPAEVSDHSVSAIKVVYKATGGVFHSHAEPVLVSTAFQIETFHLKMEIVIFSSMRN